MVVVGRLMLGARWILTRRRARPLLDSRVPTEVADPWLLEPEDRGPAKRRARFARVPCEGAAVIELLDEAQRGAGRAEDLLAALVQRAVAPGLMSLTSRSHETTWPRMRRVLVGREHIVERDALGLLADSE